jgi:hypothetical protein
MTMPVCCPTCRKMYLAPITATSHHCSEECARLDPRRQPKPGNGTGTRSDPAPPRRQTPPQPSPDRALYHRDIGAPEPDWLKAVLAPPPWE